jgi:hypothetical protein
MHAEFIVAAFAGHPVEAQVVGHRCFRACRKRVVENTRGRVEIETGKAQSASNSDRHLVDVCTHDMNSRQADILSRVGGWWWW